MLIPNRFTGRLAFLFCGGAMFLAGVMLIVKARKFPGSKIPEAKAAVEAGAASKK
jgi:hypothetical protein